jgi:hypothetical protein
MVAGPLRLSRERAFLYGGALASLCLVQVRFVVAQNFGDWSAFWAAAATVGTRDLLDPARHTAWQVHHHLLTTVFPYLPGAAWFLLPVKPVSLAAGYAINFFLMLSASCAAAIAAARIYGLSRAFASIAAFAWAPTIAALATGQNAPLGLLLAVYAVGGLAAGSWLATGFAVGLLLYKLPYALPFVALLVVRRQGRALGIVLLCAAAWYVLSVAATAGDWQWPVQYAHALAEYAGPDARFNAVKAISIPQLLLRAGAAPSLAMFLGAAIFVTALPLLARRPLLEAASFTPLLGLAAGPHTLPYDLAFGLPALYYLMTHLSEPVRTRVICVAYVAAPLWLLSGVLRFDVLAVVCNGLVLVWLMKGLHESTPGPDLRIADSRNRGEAQAVVD